jgi:hypothetical protein
MSFLYQSNITAGTDHFCSKEPNMQNEAMNLARAQRSHPNYFSIQFIGD